MATHQLSKPQDGYVDKRLGGNDTGAHTTGPVIFTANAAGTTTTIKGADGVLTSGVNVVRIGERGIIRTSTGASRDSKDQVVTITSAASVTGTTTLTFSPAISAATASGDVFLPVAVMSYADNDSLDARLLSSGYSQAQIDHMTQNDKVYAVRLKDDAGSL